MKLLMFDCVNESNNHCFPVTEERSSRRNCYRLGEPPPGGGEGALRDVRELNSSGINRMLHMLKHSIFTS